MNAVNKIVLTVIVLLLSVLVLRSEQITFYAIDHLGLGWMVSFLLPKIGLILCVALMIGVSWSTLKKLGVGKWIASFFIIGLPITAYLVVNIPYTDDWKKNGTALEPGEGAAIVEFLSTTRPGFDGLVCFSLPGCPHCEEAKIKLEKLQKRAPELDLLVFVFAEDSTAIPGPDSDEVGSSLTHLLVPSPSESIMLNQGRFPCFFYYRNGKLVHRWFSGQFGYPAYDWVENGLN